MNAEYAYLRYLVMRLTPFESVSRAAAHHDMDLIVEDAQREYGGTGYAS